MEGDSVATEAAHGERRSVGFRGAAIDLIAGLLDAAEIVRRAERNLNRAEVVAAAKSAAKAGFGDRRGFIDIHRIHVAGLEITGLVFAEEIEGVRASGRNLERSRVGGANSGCDADAKRVRSEEHTSELQSRE